MIGALVTSGPRSLARWHSCPSSLPRSFARTFSLPFTLPITRTNQTPCTDRPLEFLSLYRHFNLAGVNGFRVETLSIILTLYSHSYIEPSQRTRDKFEKHVWQKSDTLLRFEPCPAWLFS